MKISVFGVGYVGLVQAAVLADVGHDVLCIDLDADRVERLTRGLLPIYEPGLEPLVRQNQAAGRLRFTTSAEAGVRHGAVQLVAVGTPLGEDGGADISQVLAVAETIAIHMDGHQAIIVKSTVPVGTCDKVRQRVAGTLSARSAALTFDVVFNPEFLKEGSAVADCLKPDRIIVGTDSAAAEALLREIYAPFNRNHEKMIVMDARSAELTKYAANGMLATKITFINEIANLAELLGADIEMVRHGIGSDPRIGYDFIYPGVGYGGSCFPKDVQALIHTADGIGFDAKLLKAVEARNAEQKSLLFRKIQRRFGADLTGRVFALWGLSFKPNTDDMREAPSRVLMEALWSAGATVHAYDPEAMTECARLYGARRQLVLAESKEAALEGADALVVVTEWKSFQAPDFDLIKRKLTSPVIFDGRNIYNPRLLADRGFSYYGVGRGLRPDQIAQ